MNIKIDQIKNILEKWDEIKTKGLWFSGRKGRGEFKSWWPNGQLRLTRNYKNSKMDGNCFAWYDNGQMWEKCFYVQDILQGEYKRWFPNGDLEAHKIYEMGVLKEVIKK